MEKMIKNDCVYRDGIGHCRHKAHGQRGGTSMVCKINGCPYYKGEKK